jgi:hypothetical protein
MAPSGQLMSDDRVCGAHLVGSVPLADAEQVFRRISADLGDRLEGKLRGSIHLSLRCSQELHQDALRYCGRSKGWEIRDGESSPPLVDEQFSKKGRAY